MIIPCSVFTRIIEMLRLQVKREDGHISVKESEDLLVVHRQLFVVSTDEESMFHYARPHKTQLWTAYLMHEIINTATISAE